MKTRILNSLALGGLLTCGHVVGQGLPNIGNTVQQVVQTAVERQVEQAQNTALERAVGQAEAAAANQALERAEAVQADLVQSQALEQVQAQVERVQAQAAEQAQNQIERVQEQATGQAQATVERVQEQATGQAQATVERVQAQVENAQGQIEQVQSQLERIPEQAADRAQERVPEYVPAIAGQTGIERAVEAAGAAASAVAAAVPDSAPGSEDGANGAPPGAPGNAQSAAVDPVRQTVNAADGNPAFVEITLPDGARAVEFEWVMIVTPQERARLDDEAGELLTYLTDTASFALADEGELLTFTVPPDLDANDAILDLVPDTMRDLIDRNHIYETQDDDRGSAPAPTATPLTLPMPAVCTEPVKLGMIDSSIDTAHSAFAATGAVITQRSFVEANLPQATGHGTAVAGLLVGRDDSEEQSGAVLHPLLPAATLYSASVFHANEGAVQGATVMRILSALDWLLQQDGVSVINMSLAGPPNRLLERAVSAASVKGRVIVAAVGNDGPYGAVRYPAGYKEAVAVTAVARDRGIFRFANQGEHIDYAALGVEVPTARAAGGFGPESGTSLAAPIVAAFIACELAHHGSDKPESIEQALAALDARVLDLGAPRADAVYGRGLLHP
jgi:minor extracellular protease Epr